MAEARPVVTTGSGWNVIVSANDASDGAHQGVMLQRTAAVHQMLESNDLTTAPPKLPLHLESDSRVYGEFQFLVLALVSFERGLNANPRG